MDRIIFYITDFFTLVWVFGKVTNGIQRNKIMGIGFLGIIICLLISLILSIVGKSFLMLSVLIEVIIVFFISLAVLGFIFREIPKSSNSWQDSMNRTIEEYKKE